MFTDADGYKKESAPKNWPFGKVRETPLEKSITPLEVVISKEEAKVLKHPRRKKLDLSSFEEATF